jgi:exoribonuclease II
MIQHGGAMTEAKRRFIDEFARYLESTARELVVTEIAEEFSEDALDKSNSTYCTAREVAAKLCIVHRFCDPTTEERRQHAVFTDVQREDFWLTRLSGSKEKDILFICGDDHIESFSNRLTMAGYPNKILSRHWGFELQDPKVYWANT